MSEKELQATLEKLHDEMTHTENVDSETVEKLRTTVSEILDLLARSDQSPHDLKSLQGFIQEMVARSESQHPAVVGWLRQIADGLASLGI